MSDKQRYRVRLFPNGDCVGAYKDRAGDWFPIIYVKEAECWHSTCRTNMNGPARGFPESWIAAKVAADGYKFTRAYLVKRYGVANER